MMKYLDRAIFIFIVFILEVSSEENSQKHKRQIYREQVLPALGGKIPEEAFRTDRLALNRLNKDGITVIDGVLLEAREHEKNPETVRSKPEIIKVYVTQDTRYVPPEGRYHNAERPKSVDTTYVIRKPVNRLKEKPRHEISKYLSAVSVTPKSTKISTAGSNPSKAHSNFHRFYPTIVNDRALPAQHRPVNYQTIYKPIVTPLVIPAHDIFTFSKPYNYGKEYNRRPSSWEITYAWNPFYHEPQAISFEDGANFFPDSHRQIINDYDGFFDNFHGRFYRHVESASKNSEDNLSKDSIRESAVKSLFAVDDEGLLANGKLNNHAGGKMYTDLTSIPETNFSCNGRKGTFPDVEAKCQVFHECSGWSKKSSSLCPAGTAYSTLKNRCEWWNTVTCV